MQKKCQRKTRRPLDKSAQVWYYTSMSLKLIRTKGFIEAQLKKNGGTGTKIALDVSQKELENLRKFYKIEEKSEGIYFITKL